MLDVRVARHITHCLAAPACRHGGGPLVRDLQVCPTCQVLPLLPACANMQPCAVCALCCAGAV